MIKPFGCIAAVLLIVSLSLTTASGASTRKKGEYTSGMHFQSQSGLGSAQIFDIGKSLLDFLSLQTGDKWTIVRYDSQKATYDAILKGKLDASPLWADDYVQLKEKGAALQPWFTMRLINGDKRAFCLWHAKAAGPDSIKDITGKTLILDSYWPFWILTLREYLASQGIDKPLWKVFRSFTKAPNQNSAYIAVALGKVDYYWDTNDGEVYLKRFFFVVLRKLNHSYCTKPEYSRAAMVLNRKSMGAESVKKYQSWLKKELPQINRQQTADPEMRELIKFMKGSVAKFDAANDNEFAVETQLYEKAKKNGWLDEFRYIMKKMETVKPGESISLKPDYGNCKTLCGKSKKMMACMDACMK